MGLDRILSRGCPEGVQRVSSFDFHRFVHEGFPEGVHRFFDFLFRFSISILSDFLDFSGF